MAAMIWCLFPEMKSADERFRKFSRLDSQWSSCYNFFPSGYVLLQGRFDGD